MVAVERGPFVYCAEFTDNGPDASQWKLSDAASFKADWNDGLLGGAVTLTEIDGAGRSEQTGLTLIPYYLYSNRGRGSMRVWLPRVSDAPN